MYFSYLLSLNAIDYSAQPYKCEFKCKHQRHFCLYFLFYFFFCIAYQFSVFDLVQINSLLFCFLKVITYFESNFQHFSFNKFQNNIHLSIYPWIGQYTIYALFKNLHLISNDCFCHMLSAFKKVQFLSFNFIPYWGKTQIFFIFQSRVHLKL